MLLSTFKIARFETCHQNTLRKVALLCACANQDVIGDGSATAVNFISRGPNWRRHQKYQKRIRKRGALARIPLRPHEIIITGRGRQQNTARKLNSVTSSASLLYTCTKRGRDISQRFFIHARARTKIAANKSHGGKKHFSKAAIGLRAVFSPALSPTRPGTRRRIYILLWRWINNKNAVFALINARSRHARI